MGPGPPPASVAPLKLLPVPWLGWGSGARGRRRRRESSSRPPDPCSVVGEVSPSSAKQPSQSLPSPPLGSGGKGRRRRRRGKSTLSMKQCPPPHPVRGCWRKSSYLGLGSTAWSSPPPPLVGGGEAGENGRGPPFKVAKPSRSPSSRGGLFPLLLSPPWGEGRLCAALSG